jgi:hypothetical protein
MFGGSLGTTDQQGRIDGRYFHTRLWFPFCIGEVRKPTPVLARIVSQEVVERLVTP